tara:strand:+ start:54 stop:410 length:357 start_codon:yes stop_codon:yes gene_type:complete
MYSIVVGLLIFISILLILVVLVQNSKGGGLSSQFGGGGSNQFMGVQKTNDLLEKVTWTLAILVVSLTLLTKVFLPSQPSITEISSPNIDQANEQNIVPSNAGQIEDQVNNSQEIDSLF